MKTELLWITFFYGLIFIIGGKIACSVDYSKNIYLLFWETLIFRLISVFFYYYYFIHFHGQPFLLLESDEMGYHGHGIFLSNALKEGQFNLLEIFPASFSDFGYPFFLSLVYVIFGDNILITRIIQAVISAFSVILLYKISRNYFSKEISMLAAVMMMFSPILSLFSSIHLKETVFIFIFLYIMHIIIHFVQKYKSFFNLNLIVIIFFIIVLFAFRPAVALSMFFSFLVFYWFKGYGKFKITRLIILGIYFIAFIFLINIFSLSNEIDIMINKSSTYSNVVIEGSGSSVLKTVAGLPVFIIIGILGPLPNLLNFNIDTEQLLTINLYSIDCIVKGILAFFALIGLNYILRHQFKLLIYVILVYITNFIVIALAGVTFNFRYQLLILPIFYLFASVGIFLMNKKKYTYFSLYVIIYTFIVFLYNYIKMKELGMLLI